MTSPPALNTGPFKLDLVDGELVIFWRGERIGFCEYRGSGCVSATAIFGTEAFDSDDYPDGGEDGVPLHWIEPAVTKMCLAVEARRARTAA